MQANWNAQSFRWPPPSSVAPPAQQQGPQADPTQDLPFDLLFESDATTFESGTQSNVGIASNAALATGFNQSNRQFETDQQAQLYASYHHALNSVLSMQGHPASAHTQGQPQSAPAAHHSPVHTVSTRHHQTAPPMYNPGAFSTDRVSAATPGTYPLPTVHITQGPHSMSISGASASSWLGAGQHQGNGGLTQSPMILEPNQSLLHLSPDTGARFLGSPSGSQPFEDWEKAVLLGAQREWAKAAQSADESPMPYNGNDAMMPNSHRSSASPNVGLRPSASPNNLRYYAAHSNQVGSPQRMPLTYSHGSASTMPQHASSSAQGPSQKFNWLEQHMADLTARASANHFVNGNNKFNYNPMIMEAPADPSSQHEGMLWSPAFGGSYSSDNGSAHPSPRPYSNHGTNQDQDMTQRLLMGNLQTAVLPSTLYPTSKPLASILEHPSQHQGLTTSFQAGGICASDTRIRVEREMQQNSKFLAYLDSASAMSAAAAGGAGPSGVHRSLRQKKAEFASARNRAPYGASSPSGASFPAGWNTSGTGGGISNLSASLSPHFHRRHLRQNSNASATSSAMLVTPSTSFIHSRVGSMSDIFAIPPTDNNGPTSANSLELKLSEALSDTMPGKDKDNSVGSSASPIEIPRVPPITKTARHRRAPNTASSSTGGHSHSHGHGLHHHPLLGTSSREGKISVDHDFVDRSFRSHSPTDVRRRHILDRIFLEEWFRNNKMEPPVNNIETDTLVGGGLLTGIGHQLDPAMVGGEEIGERGKSIYRIFLKHVDKEWLCLFGEHPGEEGTEGSGRYRCPKSMPGSGYTKPERAVEHIRSHIGHRPYWCEGSCAPDSQCTWKFFAKGHLEDHRKKPHKKVTCQDCGDTIRQGNLHRHQIGH